jgi:hypothetical protein
MKKLLVSLTIWLMGFLKAASYLGDFEDLAASARALGLGNSQLASTQDASAIYYNPAICALIKERQVYLGYAQYFESGIIKNTLFAFLVPQRSSTWGGLVFNNWISNIKVAEIQNPNLPPSSENRPYIKEIVDAQDLILYLTYAQLLTDNLSFGGNLKIIYRNLGIGNGIGGGVDIGSCYRFTDHLIAALRLRNFPRTTIFWSNRKHEAVFPKFSGGISWLFPQNNYWFLLVTDLEHNIDQNYTTMNLGVEYSYRENFALRVGLESLKPTLGVGFRYQKLFIDYGFTNFLNDANLGSIHKLSGGVKF